MLKLNANIIRRKTLLTLQPGRNWVKIDLWRKLWRWWEKAFLIPAVPHFFAAPFTHFTGTTVVHALRSSNPHPGTRTLALKVCTFYITILVEVYWWVTWWLQIVIDNSNFKTTVKMLNLFFNTRISFFVINFFYA